MPYLILAQNLAALESTESGNLTGWGWLYVYIYFFKSVGDSKRIRGGESRDLLLIWRRCLLDYTVPR